MGEKIRNYSFVTANLVDPDTKEKLQDTRQGVYLATLPDHTILVAGVGGNVYLCADDAIEVPDKNLMGESREFTIKIREINR